MVSFRLSADEFDQFEHLCRVQRARSVSDLARTAVRQFLASDDQAGSPADDLNDLRQQMRTIFRELDRLAQVVESGSKTRAHSAGGE